MFNCGKTGLKKDNCPELRSSDNDKKSLDKKESNNLILCVVSETCCRETKEKKKSVRFSHFLECKLEILPPICDIGMICMIDGD